MRSMISSRAVAKIHVAAASSSKTHDIEDREKAPLVADKLGITDYETMKHRIDHDHPQVMYHDHIMLEDHNTSISSNYQSGTAANKNDRAGIELSVVKNLECEQSSNFAVSEMPARRYDGLGHNMRERETADSIHEEFYGRIGVGELAGKQMSRTRIQGIRSQGWWGNT
jgi:hypothetical protein